MTAEGASAPSLTIGADDNGEGGITVPVDAMPGWHEHPECPDVQGRPLRHLHHGFFAAPPPHTHEPVQKWGAPIWTTPRAEETP